MPNIPIADKTTLDTINTNIGSNVDTASATGSIHAKLKYLQTPAGIYPTQARGFFFNAKDKTAGTYTVVNVTGCGKVTAIIPGGVGGSAVFSISVSVDGGASDVILTNSGTNSGWYSDYVIPVEIYFRTSLLVQFIVSGENSVSAPGMRIYYSLV